MNNTTGLQLNNADISSAQRTLFHVSFLHIRPGECWGILGINGVGKSTLLHHLAGLAPLKTGLITLHGKPLTRWPAKQRAQHIGVLLQEQHSPFPSSVLESVSLGRFPHQKPWDAPPTQNHSIVEKALKQCDLWPLKQRNMLELSLGEQRRVAIASLLAQQPDIYLLDEPNNHLDIHYQHYFLHVFRNLCDNQNKSTVMVLHDPNLAQRYCTHIILLYPDGNVQQGPLKQLMTAQNLTTLYRHHFTALNKASEIYWLAE